MTRIRVQFDDGSTLLNVAEMPRIGEGLMMPAELDPMGNYVFRVIDVAHYPRLPEDQQMMQRADVRVAGTLTDGPRDVQP